MLFNLCLKAPFGVIGRALPVTVISAFGLTACVPIPIPSGIQFMPNRADLTVPLMDDGGCGFGPDFAAEGYREFGEVRVSAKFTALEVPDASAVAEFDLVFTERSRTGVFQNVSLDPALVRLEEAERSHAAVSSSSLSDLASSTTARTAYTLVFPPGTGFDDDVRLVFGDGAVTINGSPVTFGPIRFERRETTSIYLFPCIPS